jgi:hypothetical protein
MTDKICRRKIDGALFAPSCPDNWTDGDAIAAMIRGGPQFYFRRVVLAPRKWWQFSRRWKRTGEIWEPKSNEFDILSEDEARGLAIIWPDGVGHPT